MSATGRSQRLHVDFGLKKGLPFVRNCFDLARSTRRYQNKWYTAQAWVDIINQLIIIPQDLKFTSKDLNMAIGRGAKYKAVALNATTVPNPLGLYATDFSPRSKGKGRI